MSLNKEGNANWYDLVMIRYQIVTSSFLRFFSNKGRIFGLYGVSLGYLMFALLRSLDKDTTDFSVYWSSSLSLQQDGTAYIKLDPSLPYVNGPLFSSLLSHLTFLSYTQLLVTWFVLNIFFMFSICRMALRRFFSRANAFDECGLFALLAISYPVRYNLVLGQVVILVLWLVLLSYFFHEKSIRDYKSWLGAFLLVFGFELKPYLVIFLILFFILKRKFTFLLQSAFVVLILNLYYFSFLKNSTWLNWFQAIGERGDELNNDVTQTTLLSLITNNLSTGSFFASLIQIISIVILLILSFKKWAFFDSHGQLLLLLALSPIASIFSHEQDFVFSIFVALLVLTNNTFNTREIWIIILLFCLYLNIGSQEIFKSVIVQFFLTFLFYVTKIVRAKKQLVVILTGNMFIQIISLQISQQLGDFRQIQFLKLLCVILGYTCWYTLIRSTKKI